MRGAGLAAGFVRLGPQHGGFGTRHSALGDVGFDIVTGETEAGTQRGVPIFADNRSGEFLSQHRAAKGIEIDDRARFEAAEERSIGDPPLGRCGDLCRESFRPDRNAGRPALGTPRRSVIGFADEGFIHTGIVNRNPAGAKRRERGPQ